MLVWKLYEIKLGIKALLGKILKIMINKTEIKIVKVNINKISMIKYIT